MLRILDETFFPNTQYASCLYKLSCLRQKEKRAILTKRKYYVLNAQKIVCWLKKERTAKWQKNQRLQKQRNKKQ